MTPEGMLSSAGNRDQKGINLRFQRSKVEKKKCPPIVKRQNAHATKYCSWVKVKVTLIKSDK